MTIASDMKARALAEFDRLAAAEEAAIRLKLKSLGIGRAEIDKQVDACRPGLAEQRAAVGHFVTIQLMKAGVPLTGVPSHDCR
jgi:hypothetical protein